MSDSDSDSDPDFEAVSDSDPDYDSSSEAASGADVSDGVAGGADAQPSGIGVDYTRYFSNISIAFPTVDAAFQHANRIASELGFWLVKASNNKTPSGLVNNTVRCDRYGVYKSKANPDKPSNRSHRSSKKCNCPFAIKIVEGVGEFRGLFGIVNKEGNGTHNHDFLPFLDGHRRKSTLTPEFKKLLGADRDAHVAPRHVKLSLEVKLNSESGNSSSAPCLRSIYNFNYRHDLKKRGERNRGQEMLNLAREKKYIYYFELDDDGSLSRIFMCHPESAKMYRAWPYVVVMDSTYKTNKYDLPVVEMIGVSPVGKNFVMAYVVLNNETTESYVWAVRCLKELLPEGVLPTTIVTDRELGLIPAIEEVFGEAVNHVLCIWHIYNAVEAYHLHVFNSKGAAARCARTHFKKMIDASTKPQYRRAWEDFKATYRNRGGIVQYINNTWLQHKKKWAKYYTNEALYLGNTASSRVEAAHAVFKTWSQSAKIGCDTLWTRADGMMVVQHSELRKALSDSAGTSLVGWAGPYARLFTHLSGRVCKLGILLMRKEYDRGSSLGVTIYRDCGCAYLKTHGLPCPCQLHEMDNMGMSVNIQHIHAFWKAIVYGDHPVAEFDHRQDMRQLFDEISDLDPSMFYSFRDAWRSWDHPEREDIQEPRVAQTRKGRPWTSTTRRRSQVEHARRNAREIAAPLTLTEVTYPHFPEGPQE